MVVTIMMTHNANRATEAWDRSTFIPWIAHVAESPTCKAQFHRAVSRRELLQLLVRRQRRLTMVDQIIEHGWSWLLAQINLVR